MRERWMFVIPLWPVLVAGLIVVNNEMTVQLPHVHQHEHSVFTPDQAEPISHHRVTAYCQCKICCSKWADGYTASGSLATQGRTIAADTSVWGMGTCLTIPGVGERIVEDTGSAIKWRSIDVFFDDHEEARRFGVRFVPVEEC